MKKIYACLLGEWVCLNDDPDCAIGNSNMPPYQWAEEGAEIYAPVKKDEGMKDSYYYLDYVHIKYHGKHYRINPVFIQVLYD